MTTFIALLRGINVGGNNKMPMADLRAMLEGLGFVNVQTYIQSGNAVFAGEGAAGELRGINPSFLFTLCLQLSSDQERNQ